MKSFNQYFSAKPKGARHGQTTRDTGLRVVDDLEWESMYGLAADNAWRRVYEGSIDEVQKGHGGDTRPAPAHEVRFVERVAKRFGPTGSKGVLSISRVGKAPLRPPRERLYAILSAVAAVMGPPPSLYDAGTPTQRAKLKAEFEEQQRHFLKDTRRIQTKAFERHTLRFILLASRAGFDPVIIADTWELSRRHVEAFIEHWISR